MNIRNILFKLVLLFVLIAHAGIVDAARISPKFTASELTPDKTWNLITFPNKSNVKMYANTETGKLSYSSATPTDDYKWYLIGTADDFILKSVSGYYAYTTETGTGKETAYQVTNDATLATHFNLVNGDNENSWAIHRITGGTENNINHRNGNEFKEWQVDVGCNVTFTFFCPIYFSAAPSDTEWADDTKWFKWKNNRSTGYFSTSADYVSDTFTPILTNTSDPDDRGGLWAFVGDNVGGFRIYNNAYGPQFLFAHLGGNNYGMVHENEIPAGAVTTFTYNDQAVVAYVFRIGTTGSNQIHCNGSQALIQWNGGGSLRYDDQGSCFTIEAVEDDYVNTLPEYDVYKVTVTTGGNVSYKGTRGVFGKRGTVPSPYFILAKGDPEVSQDDINTVRDIESFTCETPTGSYIKQITLTLSYPVIVHRTPWTIDKVNNTSDGVIPPENTGFLQKDPVDRGMTTNTNTSPATSIQHAPVFELTEYIKPGTSKAIWLPTCNTNGSATSLKTYQRWYNYDTEGTVATTVHDFATLQPNGMQFSNGYVTGNIYGSRVDKSINVSLPSGTDHYNLALDHSRFEDYKKNFDGADNLLEPTISQRVIYHLVDANVIAQQLEDLPTDQWLEDDVIHFPSKKLGTKAARSGFDIIGLDNTFGNYWFYANASDQASKNPTQVTGKGDFTFDVNCSDPAINVSTLGIGVLEKNNNTMPGAVNLQLPSTFSGQRFIMFNYPEGGQFADKTELTIKVLVHGKRVAKFTLIFDDGTEPLPILDVIGKNADGTHKSQRATSAMIEQFGQPIAKVTFDGPQIAYQFPTGLASYDAGTQTATYNWSSGQAAKYGLPVSNQYTDYSFFGGGGSGDNQYMAMGEYRIDSEGNGTSGRFKVRPVEEYKRAVGDTPVLTTTGYKEYFAFADVSEQPGKIISIPFSSTICRGQRIYMQGWVASATSVNDNGQQQSSVVLKVYGIKDGHRTLVYSYCPGIISSAFERDGHLYKAVENDFSGYRESNLDNGDWTNQGYVIWNQVNCSFLIDGTSGIDNYILEVDNNCYSSTGCDVIIDNFCVFVNPPKGNVDFTIPLCTDKVRHAKVHTDYDMLRAISGVNDEHPEAQITASYCFLDAEIFDNYEDHNGEKIIDLFDIDAMGNHNLKAGIDDTDEKVLQAINDAFGAALVGRRCGKLAVDSEGNPYEDYGFHSYTIDKVYENIPVYSYADSKSEVIYREVDVNGVRRIVFREPVVRGEMTTKTEGDGRVYWPFMRPSKTYYLVFAPFFVTDEDITNHTVATHVFNMHESCSFCGKFTTKDPMHVIIDNADIESDLPVTAVCHGETVNFQFDMPALKESLHLPIYDEAYCTSDNSMHGQEVPGTDGEYHYRYQPEFDTEPVQTIFKGLPYDWWLGGRYFYEDAEDPSKNVDMTFDGDIAAYKAAKHPVFHYIHPEHNHTHASGYKADGQPVDIALAMMDFRFYYPDFGKDKYDADGNCTLTDADWDTITMHDYDNHSGYSLLWSEINTVYDLWKRGLLILHRTSYDMALTADKAKVQDGKKYIFFTLLPIMPSQHNYVDEPYIFCPEPRGVKIQIFSDEPKMLDGFAEMPYPDDMDNVPVRLGRSQIKAVPYNDAEGAKTLRIPVRGLAAAHVDGHHVVGANANTDKPANIVMSETTGYGKFLFLKATNDPAYQAPTADGEDAPAFGVMTAAKTIDNDGGDDAFYTVGQVKDIKAVYDDQQSHLTTDDLSKTNYIDIQFDDNFPLHEGYIYRLGFNFVELDNAEKTTLSCLGTMFFDVKVVPEYQKWTGAVSNDWTNDLNWQRASRADLHADASPTGDVIDGATNITLDALGNTAYPDNDANGTPVGKAALSFVPMHFTNTLIAQGAPAPALYDVTPASRTTKSFLTGLVTGTASDDAKYDLEVYDTKATGATDAWHAEGNYECGLFGTYVAKGITFEPATMMYNAYLLDYQKAWVEYELETNRWYSIASPLQETFSGEWFSPTGSGADAGRELSPHFYDIHYDVTVNNRFNPAYYQRSWDKGTANMFLCQGDGHSWINQEQSPVNVAVALNWSKVYNDTQVDYSAGGFSVKPVLGSGADAKVLVRMPKADATYLYYDKGDETLDATHRGDETQMPRTTAHYRLFSDKLAESGGEFTQRITNGNGQANPYYLVCNPLMTPFDMDAFFDANPQFEAGKYWIVADGVQIAAAKTDNGWFATNGDAAQGVVAPLQSFFVKLKESANVPGQSPDGAAGNSVSVTFNRDMQKRVDASWNPPTLKAPADRAARTAQGDAEGCVSVLRIQAFGADGTLGSEAAVYFGSETHNACEDAEDAELLFDTNIAECAASVFTTAAEVGGGHERALQLNALGSEVRTIPFGVIAPSDDMMTMLVFTGVDALAGAMSERPMIYDAACGAFYEVEEGMRFSVSGSSAGRFFIVSGMHLPFTDEGSAAEAGRTSDLYNLRGIRVASPQRGTITLRGSRKEAWGL